MAFPLPNDVADFLHTRLANRQAAILKPTVLNIKSIVGCEKKIPLTLGVCKPRSFG
jgi:hypothetical protein